MKNTDDEKCGDTDYDAGQMIFHQKFHSSTLLCFSEQNTCPVGKTDTEHAAGNVPSMSSSFAAKIRLSRGQKQIYLYFAEAEYLRRSQRLGSSRDFICILPKRDGVKDTESREKTRTCSQFSGAHSIFYKDRERKSNCAGSHVKISGPKSYPSPSKYNPRQNKIGLFDRGVISRCAT